MVSDRPQYEHDASKGETRYPPEEGAQFGGRPGERDPHSRLNTPLSELDRQTDDGLPGAGDSPTGREALDADRDPVEVEDAEAAEALRRAQQEAAPS